MFYQLFLGDYCLGKQCYEHCKYKYKQSSADIRIGDLWGKTYIDNEDGVSGAVAFTEKGNDILKQCNCELVEHTFDVVAEGQMKSHPKKPKIYERLLQVLRTQDILTVVKFLNNIKKRHRRLGYLKNPTKLFTVFLKNKLK